MMDPLVFPLTFGAAVALFGAIWVASLPLRDASIVDRFWGAGFVVIAIAAMAGTAEPTSRAWLVLLLVTLWGARLSLHITMRNLGHGEDYRYRAMRRRWGSRFPLVSLATVFGLQAVLAWVVALPLVAAIATPEPSQWGVLDGVAAVVWLSGFLFEAVGDDQLRRFRASDPAPGTVMNRGLWQYTRHPNYFGDALQWWGLGLFAVSVGAWWTAIGPALMTFLLMRVSGVALLEKKLRRTRPEYEAYCRRTNAFFPWPPRPA